MSNGRAIWFTGNRRQVRAMGGAACYGADILKCRPRLKPPAVFHVKSRKRKEESIHFEALVRQRSALKRVWHLRSQFDIADSVYKAKNFQGWLLFVWIGKKDPQGLQDLKDRVWSLIADGTIKPEPGAPPPSPAGCLFCCTCWLRLLDRLPLLIAVAWSTAPCSLLLHDRLLLLISVAVAFRTARRGNTWRGGKHVVWVWCDGGEESSKPRPSVCLAD